MDLDQFIAAAESLDQDSLDRLAGFYAQDCRFTDPFQTVSGRQQVRNVYAEMLKQLHQPRFHQVHLMGAPDPISRQAVIGWTFEFALGPKQARHSIAGCSRLTFNARGEIQEHVDFWDASQLMQAFPLLGPVIGWVRRKIGHAQKP